MQQLTYEKQEKFHFYCGNCQGECCHNVYSPVFLTPYDIAKIRQFLNTTTEEFISKYSKIIFYDDRLPRSQLLFPNNVCPFVGKNSCNIFSVRPYTCRMHPVGNASDGKYMVLADCGIKTKLPARLEKLYSIEEWFKVQELENYERHRVGFNKLFQELKEAEFAKRGREPIEELTKVVFKFDTYIEEKVKEGVIERPKDEEETMKIICDTVRGWLKKSP